MMIYIYIYILLTCKICSDKGFVFFLLVYKNWTSVIFNYTKLLFMTLCYTWIQKWYLCSLSDKRFVDSSELNCYLDLAKWNMLIKIKTSEKCSNHNYITKLILQVQNKY